MYLQIRPDNTHEHSETVVYAPEPLCFKIVNGLSEADFTEKVQKARISGTDEDGELIDEMGNHTIVPYSTGRVLSIWWDGLEGQHLVPLRDGQEKPVLVMIERFLEMQATVEITKLVITPGENLVFHTYFAAQVQGQSVLLACDDQVREESHTPSSSDLESWFKDDMGKGGEDQAEEEAE